MKENGFDDDDGDYGDDDDDDFIETSECKPNWIWFSYLILVLVFFFGSIH